MSSISQRVISAAGDLSAAAARLKFRAPVACVYNPLEYAWPAHESYLERFAARRKRVIFLGMNPGPFGMAQTGVPFGEVAAVGNWMGIRSGVSQPRCVHPKRPIQGFACTRSEVSGRRLWGLFADRFGTADEFFADHFVANYCPLVFMDEGGRNLTPDKLPVAESEPLYAVCDLHLRALVSTLQPEWLIGVGDFAEKRARLVLPASTVRIGRILHPSPASPAANRGWDAAAAKQLRALGVWR